MMAFVLVLLWLAAGHRLIVLRRAPTTVTTYYAIAAVGVAMALTMKVIQPQFDALAGPYMSDLVLHLFVIVGGVGAQLFLLTLKDADPGRRAVALRVAIAGAVFSVMVVAFAVAPIHAVTSGTLDEHYGKLGSIATYRVAMNAYLTYVLVDNIRLCRRYAKRREDLGRAVGLTLVGWGCAAGLVYSCTRLLFAILDPFWAGEHHGLLLVAQAAALVSLGLLALGVLTPFWLPDLLAWREARRGTRQLDALWVDLSAEFPAVVLPTGPAWTVHRAQLRYDRRMLEIAEGLARAKLAEEAADTVPVVPEGVENLAVALKRSRGSWAKNSGPKAAAVLPRVDSPQSEQRLLLELAAAYAAVPPRQRAEGGLSC